MSGVGVGCCSFKESCSGECFCVQKYGRVESHRCFERLPFKRSCPFEANLGANCIVLFKKSPLVQTVVSYSGEITPRCFLLPLTGVLPK